MSYIKLRRYFLKGKTSNMKKIRKKQKPQISGICFSPQLEANGKLKKKQDKDLKSNFKRML